MIGNIFQLRSPDGFHARGQSNPTFGSFALDHSLQQSRFWGGLSLQDVEELTQAIFAAPLLRRKTFVALQEILRRFRPFDQPAALALEEFVHLEYGWYVHRKLTLGQPKGAASVPYRLDYIPATTPLNRRPRLKLAPKYLTIHSTGNPKSSAAGERSWLTNPQNERTASFHIVVDQKEAIECIPMNEVAWHAGDGNGNGNRASVSLEICESGDREQTLQNAIVIAATTLKTLKLGAESLRRHYDWSKKDCPRILINDKLRAAPAQTWDWFTAQVARQQV